jgi:opacity protein-like surface antigen
MKKHVVFGAVAATLLGSSAASAQLVEPGLARDIGRAVGEAAVAAERAATDAAVSAREAWRAARQGYSQSGGRFADRDFAGTEDAAVDACALAAEQQGYDRGFRAVVRDINGVERLREGWNVDGVVEARRGWRERAETWGFRCSVRDGRVVNVDLGNEFARR